MMDDTARHILKNPWKPGHYGKGIVTPTGAVYLYQTVLAYGLRCEEDGWPSHREAVVALNASYGETDLVVIHPDGRFAFHRGRPRANGDELVAAKHPALTYDPDAYDRIYA